VLRSPATIAAGEKLFVNACAGCHGTTGEGGRGPNLSDGTLIRRSANQRLYGSIKNGVPGTDMPGFPLPEDKIWSIIAYMRSLSAPAIDAPRTGDPSAGRAIFSGKGRCSSCHMIAGDGGYLGPDLTNVGTTRTVKQLRESILDPSARIAEGHQAVKVSTRTGQKIEGVAKNYNNYSLQMIDLTGKLHLFRSEDLNSMVLSNESLMPKPSLTPDELRDVLAFLSTQAVRR
jgi:putative heme-binding domain-containing protein